MTQLFLTVYVSKRPLRHSVGKVCIEHNTARIQEMREYLHRVHARHQLEGWLGKGLWVVTVQLLHTVAKVSFDKASERQAFASHLEDNRSW